jgi:benzoyl-CoA reductase/2-hydroxyglutaryl-CoA dehydratase subunit BcrC/BadD/HgdB
MLNKIYGNYDEFMANIKEPIIGWFCTYTPEEIILAADAHPYRIRGGNNLSGKSERYLPNFFCPYAVSCLDMALSGNYDFLTGTIFTNSCNAMERLYDVWSTKLQIPYSHMLDVPRNCNKDSIEFFEGRLKGFIKSIEKALNVVITEDKLKIAIKKTNKTRELLRKIENEIIKGNSLTSTRDLLEIVRGASYISRDKYNEMLSEYLEKILIQKKPDKMKKPTVMIIGSILEDMELLNIIEKTNAKVIVNELCSGSRYYSTKIDEDTGEEALKCIARSYIGKNPCPRMVESGQTRANYIMKKVEELEIDAVIYHSLKFCINHSYDYLHIKNALGKEGIPVMLAESSYNSSGTEQLRIRIEAFIEML